MSQRPHLCRVVYVAVLAIAWSCCASACRSGDASLDLEASPASPPWDASSPQAPTREGMVWVPPGELVAGTPPGRLPRVADQELAGVRVALGGFFIDRYNHPAEPGSIPQTGITQQEAELVCVEQSKRLCTELEWERACKGPQNLTYGYDDVYDPARCATGSTDALAPNGVNERCVSYLGARDMHGSAWNWTASAWGRGSEGLVAVRGGNGMYGELVGRCANGRGVAPDKRDARIGVRCCAGDANAATVLLEVKRGNRLSWRPSDDPLARELTPLAPAELVERVKHLPPEARFVVERVWIWRPIGNEELVIGGGCAHPPIHDACGVIVARPGPASGERSSGGARGIAFVSSDWWIPTVGEQDAPDRSLFVYGGDIGGAYRKTLIYDWGRVSEGPRQRKKGRGWELVPRP